MPEYAARLVGNVTDRWTKKGKEQEMAQLSATISAYAQDGWQLHSVQPVPVFGGFSQKAQGIALLAIYQKG